MRRLPKWLVFIGGLLGGMGLVLGSAGPLPQVWSTSVSIANAQGGTPQNPIYLPLVQSGNTAIPVGGTTIQRVNAPYFNGAINFVETSVFWFGKVEPTANYADVRVGYNNTELYIYLAIFDRRLWYSTSPSAPNLLKWDSTTLYLDLDASQSKAKPDQRSYRFDAQFYSGSADNPAYRTAYRGDGSGWSSQGTAFTILPGWRGDFPNNDLDDKGWAMTYRIPFASLGLSGPPSNGALWNLGLSVHDRDDAAGTGIPDQSWPVGFLTDRPGSWGQLRFGLPTYSTPPASQTQTATIRHRLNGETVVDSEVGGHTTCGGDPAQYWNVWGNTTYPGTGDYNVQNQADISDWPCFSKIYVTFPLGQVPAGKVIVSASLTMHLMGNSNGAQAKPSLIQVLRATGDWQESTLTWNNAPQALENVSRTWVNPVTSSPAWPGVPYSWDVSRAVSEAYASGEPLRLALYSADSEYHSGKYFVSSDTGDWNAQGRPTLTITWGQP